MSDVLNEHPGEAAIRGAVVIPMSHEARAKFLIANAMRRWCIQSLGPRLKAVILTGSLARDEATFLQAGGRVHFLSDAEFILILQDRTQLPEEETITLICRAAEDELRNLNVVCKLSLGAAHESYLSRLGGTIFGYELLTCGEVVYGNCDLIATQGEQASRNISREDAWRLLANRAVELLNILPEVTARGMLSDAAQYRLIKLYLDMAASLLVFKGEFVAGYRARTEKLRELQAQGNLADLPLETDQFVQIVQRCTEFKIKNAWPGNSLFVSGDFLKHAVSDLCLLWSWELAKMNAAEVHDSGCRAPDPHAPQPLSARLRGWLYAARREGAGRSLSHLARWLRLMRRRRHDIACTRQR